MNREMRDLKYRQVGSRDIYQAIKTGEMYSFDIKLNPVSTTLINYGINLPNGTGTIEKSLSFLYSEKLNGVENYFLFKGARCDKCEVSIQAEGTVDVAMTFLCKDMTVPSTTSGLSTPTFATPGTPLVWTNLSGGSNPFTFNSNPVPVTNFKFGVTQNLTVEKPNGELQAMFIDPTNRECTISFDTYAKDSVLMTDSKNLTSRNATYKLTGPSDTPANVTATFTQIWLEKMTTSLSPTANEVQKESYDGIVQSVAVA